ncbi:hypothetical protein C815_01173 [Firmicutes bacterium M10-2]|nr:hypothetical protein C815_01173 [Firmicutes bacterium M10-2]
MKLIEIAAIGKHNELGKNNEMIWHLPKDLKFFRQTTQGKTIVMGRNTFLSLPKMLPNRHHVVISKTMEPRENIEVFRDLQTFFDAYSSTEENVYVIGGGELYRSLLPYSKELILTHIDAEDKTAQVYFPAFDPNEFNTEIIDEDVDNGIKTNHVRYIRK